MVARFLCRLVSLFFLALALLFWLVMAAAIYAQLKAQTFDLEVFLLGIISPIMALMMHLCSNDARRAARTYRHDPLWRDYP
jgi:ABC-type transport system involved in cytochrome c biogenesis permease subunit